MNFGISPKIIYSIAQLYTDRNRVLLEYLDNSLDAVEQYFNYETNTYSKPIIIEIFFEGTTKQDFRIRIVDNGNGISDLENVISSLGNSCKENDEYTNGQFGFGILSFIKLCEKLTIITKTTEA